MKLTFTKTIAWEIVPGLRATAFPSPCCLIFSLTWLNGAAYLRLG